MNPERPARLLAAGVALGLLVLAVFAVRLPRSSPGPSAPTWATVAPPHEVPIRAWRWLTIGSLPREHAHFAIGPSLDDPAHLEALPAWQLQRPVAGVPADTLVVTLRGRGDDPAAEARLTALIVMLVRNLPTLSIRSISGDRRGVPPGLDAERLRFRVRALVERGGAP